MDREKGNKGFPLALLEPGAFVALRQFCRENGISQAAPPQQTRIPPPESESSIQNDPTPTPILTLLSQI